MSLFHTFERQLKRICFIFFILLCIRFVFASCYTQIDNIPQTIIVFAVAFGLGVWSYPSAFFAFALYVPIFRGLEQSALLSLSSIPSFVFSAIILGYSSRAAFAHNRWLTTANRDSQKSTATSSQRQGNYFSILEITQKLAYILKIAITIAIASKLFDVRNSNGWLKDFWTKSDFPYESPLYFITAGFIWLQGLFFFTFALKEKNNLLGRTHFCLVVYAIVIIIFWLIQIILHLPFLDLYAPFSPYEETHALSGVTSSMLVYLLATISAQNYKKKIMDTVLSLALMVITFFCYNRISWSSVVFGCGLVIWWKLPKKYLYFFGFAIITSILILNFKSKKLADTWHGRRLTSLARIESFESKDAPRSALYKRAIRMIKARPLTGFGVGSYYTHSLQFGRETEQYYDYQTFAHNLILQLTAEMGVPITIVFCILIILALSNGYTSAKAGSSEATGLLIATVVYLTVQMATHVLSTYVSQQFFFWLLIAALTTAVKRTAPVVAKSIEDITLAHQPRATS